MRVRVFIYSSAYYLRTEIFLPTHSYKLSKNDVYYQYLMHTLLLIRFFASICSFPGTYFVIDRRKENAYSYVQTLC